MDSCALDYDNPEVAFTKIFAVCRVNRLARSNPEIKDLYIARGKARNRIPNFDEPMGLQLLKEAHAAGVSIDKLRDFTTIVHTWDEFKEGLEELAEHPSTKLTAITNRLRRPSAETLRALATGSIKMIGESLASPQAVKQLTPPSAHQCAAELLQRASEEGEQFITIDFDKEEFYFGMSRDGAGRTFNIEQPWVVRELADALKNKFQFVP